MPRKLPDHFNLLDFYLKDLFNVHKFNYLHPKIRAFDGVFITKSIVRK